MIHSQGQVQAIVDHPAPTNIKELLNFLEVMNFYWRFMPGMSQLHRPLTEALKSSPKPKTQCTEEMRTAFQAAKETLRVATNLAFPWPQAELALIDDASMEEEW